MFDINICTKWVIVAVMHSGYALFRLWWGHQLFWLRFIWLSRFISSKCLW